MSAWWQFAIAHWLFCSISLFIGYSQELMTHLHMCKERKREMHANWMCNEGTFFMLLILFCRSNKYRLQIKGFSDLNYGEVWHSCWCILWLDAVCASSLRLHQHDLVEVSHTNHNPSSDANFLLYFCCVPRLHWFKDDRVMDMTSHWGIMAYFTVKCFQVEIWKMWGSFFPVNHDRFRIWSLA